jgi:hypothetical protein
MAGLTAVGLNLLCGPDVLGRLRLLQCVIQVTEPYIRVKMMI